MRRRHGVARSRPYAVVAPHSLHFGLDRLPEGPQAEEPDVPGLAPSETQYTPIEMSGWPSGSVPRGF